MQLVHHREQPLRAQRAVGSQPGHREVAERAGDLPRGLAAEGVPVVGEGGLRDDRDVGQAARHRDRFHQLVQVAEGLEDEHVDAAFDERLDLLAERLDALPRRDPVALARGYRW